MKEAASHKQDVEGYELNVKKQKDEVRSLVVSANAPVE